jgi:hypothetical protein
MRHGRARLFGRPGPDDLDRSIGHFQMSWLEMSLGSAGAPLAFANAIDAPTARQTAINISVAIANNRSMIPLENCLVRRAVRESSMRGI